MHNITSDLLVHFPPYSNYPIVRSVKLNRQSYLILVRISNRIPFNTLQGTAFHCPLFDLNVRPKEWYDFDLSLL